MYKRICLVALCLKQGWLIIKIVLLLTLLPNTMIPDINVNSNVQLNSDTRIVAHIVKYSSDAEVHLRGSSLYKTVQKVHNGLCKNIFPDLIVVPKSTEDVSKIVKITRRHDTPISIRSGGHSYICSSIKQGRYCIDNSVRSVSLDP